MTYYTPTTEEARARREALAEFDEWNGRCLLAAFSLFGLPASYLDLGCGTGAMAYIAHKLGVDALGVDVAAAEGIPFLRRHDLREPLSLGRQFDLVSCIEVAEHLHAEFERTLVASIAAHTRPGGLVIFTAAQPGQPGDHHVNAVGSKHWEALFYAEGLNAHAEYTLGLSLLWRYVGGPLSHHLPANLTVYHKGAGL